MEKVEEYQENTSADETDEDHDNSSESDEEESIKPRLSVKKRFYHNYMLKRLEKCIMTCDDQNLPYFHQPCYREIIENKWIGLLPSEWNHVRYIQVQNAM